MKTLNQNGISHVVVLVLVAVVGVAGFAGYRVSQNGKSSSTAQQSSTAQPAAQTAAPKIESKEQVKAEAKSIDASNVDGELDSSSLDADINDLM